MTARTLVSFGKDELVLERVFEPRQFGHAHFVALGLQEKSAQNVRQMCAEFAPLDGMAPQLPQ
jgi:hypothetical protein